MVPTAGPDIALGIAPEIRAEAARKGITLRALADSIGISRQALSRKLNGHVGFTLRDLCASCRLLETPASELVRRAEAAALAASSGEGEA